MCLRDQHLFSSVLIGNSQALASFCGSWVCGASRPVPLKTMKKQVAKSRGRVRHACNNFSVQFTYVGFISRIRTFSASSPSFCLREFLVLLLVLSVAIQNASSFYFSISNNLSIPTKHPTAPASSRLARRLRLLHHRQHAPSPALTLSTRTAKTAQRSIVSNTRKNVVRISFFPPCHFRTRQGSEEHV